MKGCGSAAYACCSLDRVDAHDTSNLRCQFDDVEVVATYDGGVVACMRPSVEVSRAARQAGWEIDSPFPGATPRARVQSPAHPLPSPPREQ